MRLIITGSTGFLANHLIQAIIPSGHEVIGVGRSLDRLDFSLAGIDALVHLAAQTEMRKAVEDPIETFEGNIRGTWRVLEACRKYKVRRVIVASSDKAYGRSEAPYDERTIFAPDRPYETSKACADLIARTYASTYGMSVAVTRCVNLYGPGHLNFSTLIPGTIKRIIHGERPIIRNGGRMKRDFLFVEDAVDAYARLLESDYVGPINLGTGTGYAIGDVSRLIIRLMDAHVEPIDEPDKHGEIVDQWSGYELAEKELGWKPRHSLEEGLKKTISWYRTYFGGNGATLRDDADAERRLVP